MAELSQPEKQENLVASLTERQLEVSCLLARGMKNPEIAAALGIEMRTVCSHLENISQKLGVHGRERLIVWAWKNGLAEK
ncbi:MAG TPA: LuxR C-terminal-related transcriptional regulator [Anaerolineales bacterium]|nr:LuxR C-terminal-related transcriptional regulator [Anaerolineales bacterium]